METSLKIAEDLSKKISKPVHLVSAVSGNNVKNLIRTASNLIDKENEEELLNLSFPVDHETVGKNGLTF